MTTRPGIGRAVAVAFGMKELAPAFVYFGSSDSTFTIGAILEVTGGKLSSS